MIEVSPYLYILHHLNIGVSVTHAFRETTTFPQFVLHSFIFDKIHFCKANGDKSNILHLIWNSTTIYHHQIHFQFGNKSIP